ncbi:MAG: phosphotransferase family protein [Pseudomonadota bacterium]
MAKMGNISDFETRIGALFTSVFGGSARLESMKRLSGGASQETWALSGSGQTAILRRAPGGTSNARSSAAIGLPMEAKLIQIASRSGVPVPKVLHVLGPADALGDGFLMNRVEGETIARPILRNDTYAAARATLAAQCGQALAAIHATDLSALPADLPVSDGLAQIAQYEEIYRGFETPRPVFELALQWLKTHAPTPRPTVLVHGDFRLGNLMVDESGLAAVLDWELAHLGDPREDIAWICVNSWRFGVTEKRVGGFGTLEDLLAAYNRASALEITPREIDWWEMLGSLKWGIMCMIMYEAFRSGGDPSVERAAIGRRVSETEIDLINLLEAAHA